MSGFEKHEPHEGRILFTLVNKVQQAHHVATVTFPAGPGIVTDQLTFGHRHKQGFIKLGVAEVGTGIQAHTVINLL